jgi:hypothetical protein
MGLLRLLCTSVAVLGLACYSPEVRDCSVRCTAVDDCAGDQHCGADGLCVSATEIRCGDDPGGETGNGSQTVIRIDAGMPNDALAPPDGATGSLSLSVEGKGQLEVVGITSCSGRCVISVPLALPVTIHAVPGNDFYFDRWTAGSCSDDDTTCTFSPAITMSVGAKFRRED